MLTSKHGNWWEKHPHRARANNSAVLLRGHVSMEEFFHVYDQCIASNAGEPGFFWTNDLDWGTNPCAEIALQSNQFCNLTTTNLTGIKNEKDFDNRIYAASFLGTLQATYTDFPYLSERWKQVTEEEALIGCSFTGIADSSLLSGESLRNAARTVLDINAKYSKKLGINPAARATAIKPEGTASCVLGSSSGIHARHDQFYLRRVRMNRDDELAKYLMRVCPELVEADLFSQTGVVVTIPQESPAGAVLRNNESAIELFERVKLYYENWVVPGHRSGANTHNVSCTINYRPEETELLKVKLWEDRESYAAVALLPASDTIYQQAPFEGCDEATFHKFDAMVKDIDLTKVMEMEDNTNRAEQLACGGAGGSCEII
jgi:ribonucleoside-diphosphate reductase alpha chain